MAGRDSCDADIHHLFPTLLDMLGVSSDEWRGVGISVLDASRPEVAFSTIPPKMEGNAGKHSDEEIEHIKSAQSVSEFIIIHDLYDKRIDRSGSQSSRN